MFTEYVLSSSFVSASTLKMLVFVNVKKYYQKLKKLHSIIVVSMNAIEGYPRMNL
jgi:hypothetical protein